MVSSLKRVKEGGMSISPEGIVKKSSSNPPNPPKRLYGFWFHNPRLIFNVGAYDRLLVQEVGPFGVFYESWYLCFAIIESKRLESVSGPGVRFRFVALWNQYDKWVWCQKYFSKEIQNKP